MSLDAPSIPQTAPGRGSQRTYVQALNILAESLQGELLLPGVPDFETARTVSNGLADLLHFVRTGTL